MDNFEVDDKIEFKNKRELYGIGIVVAVEDEDCTVRFDEDGGKFKGIIRIKKTEIRKVKE